MYQRPVVIDLRPTCDMRGDSAEVSSREPNSGTLLAKLADLPRRAAFAVPSCFPCRKKVGEPLRTGVGVGGVEEEFKKLCKLESDLSA